MSVSAKVHGMDGTLVEPDWQPLTLAELRPVVAQFPELGPPEHISTVSPRPFSAAGIVETRKGLVFVKRHDHAVRDCEGLLEEHRFLAHLFANGASVPRVLVTPNGETAVEIGDSTYEIHEVPVGVDLYQDAISWTPFHNAAHAYSAGKALARVHLAAQGFAAPARKARPLVASFTIFAATDSHAELDRYLAVRPILGSHKAVRACAEEALELLAPFHSELVPHLLALPSLWTHNDLHASNIFWSNAEVNSDQTARASAIIDFGLADRTNAVHDIAHAIERNIIEWLTLFDRPDRPQDVAIHFDHLHALLDGYESVRPLTREESAALAPMAALCHAEFALSEADYFLGVLHSEEKAAKAYKGWLVGHARWFCGAGKRLMKALRERHTAHKSKGVARS